jgi:hypothetical protein
MKFVPLVVLTSTMAASPAFAQAQDNNGPSSPVPVQITPFVSIGSNASSGVGASVRWYVAPKLSVELETAFREAEVTGLTSSVSLLYDLPSLGRVNRTWLVASVSSSTGASSTLHSRDSSP